MARLTLGCPHQSTAKTGSSQELASHQRRHGKRRMQWAGVPWAKAGGSAVTEGCVAAARLVVNAEGPARSPPSCGNWGAACSPNAGFTSLPAGGPALVCHCAALEMAANVTLPLPLSPAPCRQVHRQWGQCMKENTQPTEKRNAHGGE